MTQAEARAAVTKHGGITAAATALNVTRSFMRRRLAGKPEMAPATAAARSGNAAKSAKKHKDTRWQTLEEFRAQRDPVEKMRGLIREAVALVKENDGKLISNHELRREVSCGDMKLWRDVARDPAEGFIDFQLDWKDEWFWATPETVEHVCSKYKQAKRVEE